VLFLGLYALRLTGQGLMVHIEATATARAFDENRGRALGITGLGLPLSDATMPSVALVAMALLGWRGTYAAIAIFLLAVVLPLARLLAGGTRPPTIVLAPVPIRLRLATAFRLMACRRYVWLVLPAVAVMPFLLTGLLFNASAIAAARSWSREAMAATFPAMSAISIAALILSGRLVDRFSGRRVFALHVLPLIAGLLVLAWFPADWAVPAGLMLIGVSGGVAKTSGTAIWAELFGTAHLGAIRSFVAMFTVFSTAAAPFAFGLLVDAGWSWPAILAVSAAGAALFAAPLMVAELIRPSDAG
jgi:MFS family permease